jgi:hypothetical protein
VSAGRGTGAQDPRPEQPLLLAYLQLTPLTAEETESRLTTAIGDCANSAGFRLGRVLVAHEGRGELLIVLELLQELRRTGADIVLIAGPAAHARRAVDRLGGVDVLTLSDAPILAERGGGQCG